MIEMNGKVLRDKKLEELKKKLIKIDGQLGLAIVQVGNDEASNVYVSQKEKLAKELGYKFVHNVFDDNVNQEDLIQHINQLNNDNSIDGILVQMPLPAHLDSAVIQNSIDPYKDVDGLTFINAGRLVQGLPALVPCTPSGILHLLEEYNIPIEGKQAVVIGRSLLVGKPIANLLTNENATVTICHSKTKDIELYTKNADIIIVAVGKANFLKSSMIKSNAVIIDVGINKINGKLYGDVDFNDVNNLVGYITPVPGGVGPMTVYELMNNVLIAHKLRLKYVHKKSN